jgi:O-antigen/teichoic acid export membrane protein
MLNVPEGWRKTAQHIGVFFAFLATQMSVQAISMVTGFFVIRILNKDDYATYTIINTLGPTMVLLSDNGINTGINSIARTVWQDDYQMGSLVNTGLMLRRKFAIFSFLLVGPFLIWKLYEYGVSVLTIALLLVAVAAGVSFQLSTAIMRLVLELRQNIKSLGKVSLAASSVRLILVIAFSQLLHLDALLATIAATCATICETALVARAVRRQVVWDAPPNPAYLPTVWSKVRQTMPLTVYYCIQGQISIWLISIFGNAHQVADIGSATRLSVIYGTMLGTLSTLMLPRFARNNGRRLLYQQVFQIIAAAMSLLAIVVLVTWLVPGPFVWLLGKKYANMSGLIWLVVLSQGMYSLASVTYALNLSKGWIPPAYITIPVEVITQIILLLTLDLTKTQNVLIFSCLGTIPPMIVTFWLLMRRLREEPE